MKSLMRKLLLGLALAVIVGVLIVGGIYVFRIATRPTLAKAGGTVLTYEVDTDVFPTGMPPENFKAEELAEALRRRLDPEGWDGITVRPVDPNWVEISVPRVGDHAEHLQQIKELIAQIGSLEFRILANNQDDQAALDATSKWLAGDGLSEDDKTKRKAELQRAAEKGLPPPAPTSPARSGPAFDTPKGTFTYSWVEVSRAERRSLDLDNAAETDPTRRTRWQAAARAREKEEALLLPETGQTLLYSRRCVNVKMPPGERESKKFDYFLLTRDPAPGQAITGQYLTDVKAVPDTRRVQVVGQAPPVSFRLNAAGGELFFALTSANVPTGTEGQPFSRLLAIILDGQIMTAPRLNSAIRRDGQISGNFTQQEVDRMVRILQAGALPAALKPLPVSEVTVEQK